MRIVETDNYGGDFPDEKFVNLPQMSHEACQKVCDIINEWAGSYASRYWKVVQNDYKLAPAFEP